LGYSRLFVLSKGDKEDRRHNRKRGNQEHDNPQVDGLNGTLHLTLQGTPAHGAALGCRRGGEEQKEKGGKK